MMAFGVADDDGLIRVPRLSFGSVSEAVEPLALGQREGLAHPGFLDRGPGNEVFTLLDSEVQDHCARLGVDTQENRTRTSITNLLEGRTFGEIRHPASTGANPSGHKRFWKEVPVYPLRNKGCGYLEKFAQGCEASPVAERKPEALTMGPAAELRPFVRTMYWPS